MTSSGKRALIVVAILFLILAGVAFYFIHGFGKNPVLAPGAPPDLLSLAPKDAPFIIYADVDAIKNSPAFAKGSVLFNPEAAQDPIYKDWVSETGFDYSRDLDRFVLAIWPNENTSSTVLVERIRLIAIADGRFDHAKIDSYARFIGRASNNGGPVIYETPSAAYGSGTSFTFLGPGRIAIAQAIGLDPVLNPPKGSELDTDMRERIAHVAGADFFAVARTDDLPKAIGAHELQSGQLNRLLKSVRHITLSGRPDANNFAVAAEADCDSLSNALQLATLLDTLRWFGRAALAGPQAHEQMHASDIALLDALLRLTTVSHESNQVRLRLELTPEILQGSPKTR
jgi:hypothetical protein